MNLNLVAQVVFGSCLTLLVYMAKGRLDDIIARLERVENRIFNGYGK